MKSIIYLLILFVFISFKILGEELKIINVKSGNGNQILKHSKIKVHYKGKLNDGTVFDSSYKRKQAFLFQIGTRKVIEGWEIGLLGLREGGKITLIIPPNLAYGKRGAGDLIPPNSTLTFEIEIIDVSPPGYNLINAFDLEKRQEEGFVVVDIRSKKEIKKKGKIPNSIIITAFDQNGTLKPNFLKSYQSKINNSDKVIFVSKTGDIASILANGFVEELGAKNIYSLKGGIEAYFERKKIIHH